MRCAPLMAPNLLSDLTISPLCHPGHTDCLILGHARVCRNLMSKRADRGLASRWRDPPRFGVRGAGHVRPQSIEPPGWARFGRIKVGGESGDIQSARVKRQQACTASRAIRSGLACGMLAFAAAASMPDI